MTDLELCSGAPYQPLYRISGSLRSDPFAGIDAWGWYTLFAHLRCFIFVKRLFPFDVDTEAVFIYSFRGTRVKTATQKSSLWLWDTPLWDIHTLNWLFFYLRFVTFTVLSLCSRCDLWPISQAFLRILNRCLSLSVYSLINWYFLRCIRSWICRNDIFFVNLFAYL